MAGQRAAASLLACGSRAGRSSKSSLGTGYLRTPGCLHHAAPAGAGGAERAFGPSTMTLTAIRLFLGALTRSRIIGYSAE
ncbi:hypothetical protein GCM10017667_68000 [Streptomyces filamentosus]|uniref:Uncharacterized protein n=1 Tax=Streptomyces filamentosus TaxID=67294 RepID=A0A919BVQ6_STRFL|nr:hypothetical protein GCM10017667_68000 [Streptomyces filamentosus]